jgi:hypothetical protein
VLIGLLAVVLIFCVASFVVTLGGASAVSSCAPAAAGDMLLAGAAKAEISPSGPVYLGGYGFGPVRRSTGILQPLYARALALRAADGATAHTVVFVAIDSQGYFSAYQAGPYGFEDIRARASAVLGIPVANIILASTHSHSAPDTVGFWGGVPTSYLALVRDQTISAITQTVQALAPATLSVGTADLTGDTSSFGEASRGGQGSGPAWPVDTQMRVLRAVGVLSGKTIATLVEASIHPTTLGAHNTLVSPDWPGITADTLERALGGTALVMVGALGHTWPALPPGTPKPSNDQAFLQQFGALMSLRALTAVGAAQPVHTPTLCVADRHFREADTTAPVLLGLQLVGRDGHERIMRAIGPPSYVPPDALGVEVETVRVGDVAFFAAPVEAYPSLLADLRGRVSAGQIFFLGLAGDQLGYACEPSEYVAAVHESPDDEALFIVNPWFGDQIVSQLSSAAHQIGL